MTDNRGTKEWGQEERPLEGRPIAMNGCRESFRNQHVHRSVNCTAEQL